MNKQWKSYMKQLQTILRNTDYVKPNDIPDIDLYMDQVTTFMDTHLESSKRFDSDKLLTKTMINNYTKNDLLPPPEKKKYSKDHMYLLVFIYYLKNFLSIRDVKTTIAPMAEMFFGNDEVTLENIYSNIFQMEEEQSDEMARDVMKKFIKSRRTFPEVEGESEKEYLQIFSFIAMLSFDVYLKKNLIENIIDEILAGEPEEQNSSADNTKAKKNSDNSSAKKTNTSKTKK